ncbi:MAG: hypothetical protein AAF513_00750 [Pseudomonadota bacterium]
MSPPLTTALLATLTCAVALGLIHAAWRDTGARTRTFAVLGWGGVALAGFLFSNAWGSEVGWVTGCLVVALCAWVGVMFEATPRSVRAGHPREALRSLAFTHLARNVGLFLMAVPLSAFVSVLLVVSASAFWGFAIDNRLVLVMLITPAIWGVLMAWVLIDRNRLRSSGALVGIAVVSGALLWLQRLTG